MSVLKAEVEVFMKWVRVILLNRECKTSNGSVVVELCKVWFGKSSDFCCPVVTFISLVQFLTVNRLKKQVEQYRTTGWIVD